jgi:hypothetical protein
LVLVVHIVAVMYLDFVGNMRVIRAHMVVYWDYKLVIREQTEASVAQTEANLVRMVAY